MFIGLMWDGLTNAPAMQIGADTATTVAFVSNQAMRTLFGATSLWSLYRHLAHQLLKGDGFMALSSRQDEGERLAVTVGADMNLGTKATLTAAQCLRLCLTAPSPGGILMRPNNRAVNIVHLPIQLALAIGLVLQFVEYLLPNPGFLPALETTTNRCPFAIALWQVTPRRSRPIDP